MSFSYGTRVRVGLRVGLLLAAALLFVAAPALGQTQQGQQGSEFEALPDDAPAKKVDVEEITVTGSRVRRKELEVAAPIAIYTQTDIRRAGVTSIGQLLRELPSIAGQAQTTQVNNGGEGTMSVSLRGLGAVRTLVLLNGHRLPPGVDEGADGISVDLNSIPTSAIQRVEVLKDGASAIYGSDAVAGVVNIITRQVEGVELSAFYGDSTRGGGEKKEISLSAGGSLEGKTNWTFFGAYTDEGKIEVGDRSWARVPLASFLGDVIFLGSSAPPWGNYATSGGSVTLGPEFGSSFRPFDFFGGDSYNFAPANYQRRPTKRWSVGFFADSQMETLSNIGFLRDVTTYIEANYVNSENESLLAEVPLAPFAFFGFEGAPYDAANFYNPFGETIIDWRRRMVEGGSRLDTNESDTWRLLLGLRGGFDQIPLLRDWDWDIYFQRGDYSRERHFGDIYNLERVGNAVGPTTGSPATGDLMCVADPGNCVPLNVFGQNSVTPEMLDYVTFTTNESFEAEQKIFEISFSNSELIQLPAGPLGFAWGYQWREESGEDNPDSLVAVLGDGTTGTPRQPTSGEFEVNSWFAEAVVPLLADLPLVESLEMEVAFRYTDYDTFGSTTDPKVGLRWRPFSDLLLRGTYSTAFRGPNVGELFGGAGTSFPSLTDPCSGGRDDPGDVCLDPRVGDAGFVPISTQVKETQGGRDDLDPEEADVFTLGLVWTPSQFLGFLEGFSFAVDYYDYDIEDAITTLGSDFILRSCAQRGEFCELIERFPDGNVRDIDNRTTNVGGVEAQGFDFSLAYRNIEAPFIPGDFDLQLDTTYTKKHDVIQADGSVIDHDGWFRDEQDGHFAKWRMLFGVDYHLGESFRLSWDTRWIDDVDEEYEDQGTGEILKREMNGATYHDIQLSYDYELAGLHTFQFGVDNIFNRKPPLSLDGFNDNTDVRTFDTVGRFWYTRLTMRF